MSPRDIHHSFWKLIIQSLLRWGLSHVTRKGILVQLANLQPCVQFSGTDILRTARGFWKYCKKGGGGGLLALKIHIICSSKKSCMKTNVDIVCFSLSSMFLIDPKNDDCAEEKDAHGLFFFFFFCDLIPNFFLLFFSFSPLSLFLSSLLYHASFAPSHLGYAHLI